MVRLALVSSILASSALLATPADACSCIEPEGPNIVRPGPDDQVVSQNTLVWVFKKRCQARLVDADGNDVPTTMLNITGRTHAPEVLMPDAPLEMGATYTMICDDEMAQEPIEHSFTVNAEADDVAPVVDEWSTVSCEIAASPGDTCGGEKEIVFDVQHDGEFLVTNVDGGASLSTAPDVMQGFFSDLYIDDDLRLSNESCGLYNWPLKSTGGEAGAPAVMEWGAFDLAGNFSGWTTPQGVCALTDGGPNDPEGGQVIESGCGCRVVGAPSERGGWLALLLGLGLLARRRK